MSSEIPINPDARALIFDIDGTLADTMGLHYEAWQAIIREHGAECDRDWFSTLGGMPSVEIITAVNSHLGISMDTESTLLRKEEEYIRLLQRVRPIEPVTEIVRQYHGILPLAAGTGGRRHIALRTLAAIGLDDCFDALVTAEDVEKHKPFPDTFLMCAQLMGVAPELCQVFEDSELGLEAARRAGMAATDIRTCI